MFKNLEAEMIRRSVSREGIADFLNQSYNTVCKKMRGDAVFDLDEAFAIRDRFFPGCNLEYLFAKGGSKKYKQK